jgi:hypothetical protein
MRRQVRGAAARTITTLQAQRVFEHHATRAFLHRVFLAWREPAWRSRKAIQKELNRVLYLVSQRFWRGELLLAAFQAWAAPSSGTLRRPVRCPACALTEPPGLERGRWQ